MLYFWSKKFPELWIAFENGKCTKDVILEITEWNTLSEVEKRLYQLYGTYEAIAMVLECHCLIM